MLLVSASSASAQTATPTGGVSTGVPPTSSPPPVAGVGTTVSFSFLSAQAGFAPVTGTWVSGSGFESVSGDLAVIGGYFMAGVTRVTIHYSATDSGTLDFALGDGLGGFNYTASGLYSECEDTCDMFFSPDAVDSHILEVGLAGQDGVFTLSGITVTFGGESESYSVGDDGCPILSAEQVAKLDPAYALSCSRCFTTPTPVRDSAIFVSPVPFETVDLTSQAATYFVPVDVSGTPSTMTPVPSATPFITPTPGAAVTYHYNFDDDDLDQGQVHFEPAEFNPLIAQFLGALYSPGRSGFGWEDHREEFSGGLYNSGVVIKVIFDVPVTVSDVRWWGSHTKNGDNVLGTAIWYTAVDGVTQLHSHFTSGNQPQDGFYEVGYSVPVSNVRVVYAFTGHGATAPGGNSVIMDDFEITASGADVFLTPTPTPTGTGVPWLTLAASSTPSECSVAVFRDDNVIAEFPDVLTTIDYQCYTLIPEININIPDHPLAVDGVSLCVTWFEMPIISLLGITFTLDIVLVAIAMWLAKMLLSF